MNTIVEQMQRCAQATSKLIVSYMDENIKVTQKRIEHVKTTDDPNTIELISWAVRSKIKISDIVSVEYGQ